MIESACEAAGMLQVILSLFYVTQKRKNKTKEKLVMKQRIRHAICPSSGCVEWTAARNLSAPKCLKNDQLNLICKLVEEVETKYLR